MVARVKREHLEFAKEAFQIASKKLPLETRIEVSPLKKAQ